jgi:hypothetical protein
VARYPDGRRVHPKIEEAGSRWRFEPFAGTPKEKVRVGARGRV